MRSSRLNYKPNAIARQFVRQRTTMLGVLVGDLDNPYYAQMARVVEREAFRCGYTAMFCNIEGEEEIALAGVEALLEHRIAGVVFLAFISRTPQLEEALRRAEVPIVFLGLSEQWGDSVGPKTPPAPGWRSSTCSSLGMSGSPTSARRSSSRAAIAPASRLSLGDAPADLPTLPPVAWTPGSDMVVVGRRRLALGEALRDGERPTGLFVSNDIGAISMIEACEQIGINVPADLSIVGFDDIAIAGAAPHLADHGGAAARLPGRAGGGPAARADREAEAAAPPRQRAGRVARPRVDRAAVGLTPRVTPAPPGSEISIISGVAGRRVTDNSAGSREIRKLAASRVRNAGNFGMGGQGGERRGRLAAGPLVARVANPTGRW